MGINAWLRRHPLLYALIGVVIAVIGGVRGEPVVMVIGGAVTLVGLVGAFVL
jgi:hypothetical protein